MRDGGCVLIVGRQGVGSDLRHAMQQNTLHAQHTPHGAILRSELGTAHGSSTFYPDSHRQAIRSASDWWVTVPRLAPLWLILCP